MSTLNINSINKKKFNGESCDSHLLYFNLEVDMTYQKIRGPRNGLDTKGLARVKVELVDQNGVIYVCNICGQQWSPVIQSGGRIPRGSWRCLNGCTEELMAEG